MSKSNEGLECKDQEIQTFSSIQRQFKIQVSPLSQVIVLVMVNNGLTE